MANYLDPAADETNPLVPQDSQSGDSSKSGLRKAWDAYTSRPENNAALLQFGIAMMQPRAPGQSGIGSVANAIGEGAQASERNVAVQRAEEEATSKRSMEEAKTAATTSNAESTRMNATAYGRQVDNSLPGGKTALSGMLRQQADFRKWLAKPEDNIGLTTDPIVTAIQKQFPEVKSKGDLLNNPRALSAARQLFSAQITTEPNDGGTLDPAAAEPQPAQPGAAAAPATPAAPPAPIRRYNAQGKGVEWNGTQWVPIN